MRTINDFGYPFETFNKLNYQENDTAELENIINEIAHYEVYDTLARLSSLNLLPENENKSLLLDALVAAILNKESDYYTSKYKMSSGKFRKIVERLNKLEIRYAIDPNENAFIENVMYNGNYYVFNGIDQTPAFNLQMMIYTLFVQKNSLDEDLKKRAAKIILFVLHISNMAAKTLGYEVDTLSPNEARDMVIPNSTKIDLLKKQVVFDAQVVRRFLGDAELYKDLFIEFENRNTDKQLDIRNQLFYTKPFVLNSNTDEIIVLNMALLPTYAFYKVLELSDEYNLKETILNLYNNYVFRECKKSLAELGHNKIQEKCWNIDLKNENYYKEVLLNVYNNQIMIVSFLCDDGLDYNKDTIHDMYPSEIHEQMLEERMQYLSGEIKKNNVSSEDIFCVIIISGFGRGIKAEIQHYYEYNPVLFNPFELRCLSINERTETAFLPRYIRAKNKLQVPVPNMISELNAIDIYVSNHYSFYINDDFNPSTTQLYIAPGDSIEYIIKALNKEKRKLVDSYKEGYFTEIISNDPFRNIYVEPDTRIPKVALFIPFSNLSIWVCSPDLKKYEELNLYFSIIDAITYWLAECRGIIEYSEFNGEKICIFIILNGNLKEYYYDVKEKSTFEDELKIEIFDSKINVTWTPKAFRMLNKQDNSSEKNLIEIILRMIAKCVGVQLRKISELNRIFGNPMKKKFFSLDYELHPYFKPVKDRTFRKIHGEDEDFLLDIIGKKVLESGKWSYGVVSESERTIIANYIVSCFYGLMQKEIAELSPVNFVELIYNDLEIVIYNLMLSQKRYAYDIACYTEKENDIFNEFNEMNKTSRALKFLMEYIAACPPNGKKILGEGKYEYLLAICSLIIDWAYKNDLFHYKIFNTPVEILPSDRIGMKQNEFNNMLDINTKYLEEQLDFNSSFEFREKFSSGKEFDYSQKLNEAFKEEYGYSFDLLCKCVFSIIVYGKDINNDDVKVANLSELLTWIDSSNQEISYEIAEKLVNDISLKQREDFLIPPESYSKEDIYPWRFNREYSFTRRPLIIRNNQVIWGERQLYHMLVFNVDLIHEGKFKARHNKLNQLLGEISDFRGAEFNNQIYEKICHMGLFDVIPNVKKVNGKSIEDENKNTLGDIDVLIIIRKQKKILVAEAKDFNFSKNPYEMYLEHQKMFVDTKKKKCFVTKHKRRTDWVRAHINDMKAQYGLEGEDWIVKGIFIVSEPIVSNTVYLAGATIITNAELTPEKLIKV